MRSFKVTFSVVALGMLAAAFSSAGCSSNASATDTVQKIRSQLCQRWSECYTDAFTQAYPSGQSQCVDAAMKQLTDAQKNSVSPCSDSEVSTCASDIKGASCDSVSNGDTTKLPSSCQKC